MRVEPHSAVSVLIKGRLNNVASAVRECHSLREGDQKGSAQDRTLHLDSDTAVWRHI